LPSNNIDSSNLSGRDGKILPFDEMPEELTATQLPLLLLACCPSIPREAVVLGVAAGVALGGPFSSFGGIVGPRPSLISARESGTNFGFASHDHWRWPVSDDPIHDVGTRVPRRTSEMDPTTGAPDNADRCA